MKVGKMRYILIGWPQNRYKSEVLGIVDQDVDAGSFVKYFLWRTWVGWNTCS